MNLIMLVLFIINSFHYTDHVLITKFNQYVGDKAVHWGVVQTDSTLTILSEHPLKFQLIGEVPLDSSAIAKGGKSEWMAVDTDSITCIIAHSSFEGRDLIWIIYSDYVFVFRLEENEKEKNHKISSGIPGHAYYTRASYEADEKSI